jgi:hypothetical protein
LKALKNILTEVDLILETTPPLPQNRTGRSRELIRAALALTDDLTSQIGKSPAAIMGHKGGSSIAATRGPEYFRQLAAKRKTYAGGRPRKETKN